MKKNTSFQYLYGVDMLIGLVCLLLVSCQVSNNTIPLSLTKAPIPTPFALSTPTQLAGGVSPTPMETAVLIPAQIPTLTITFTVTSTFTPTATPFPWQVGDLSDFFFYAGDYEIYLFHPDGMNQFIDRGNVLFDGQPWSSDGTKFIFNARLSSLETINLVIADLATGELTPLNFMEGAFDAFWSPDGRYIVYASSKQEGETQLIVQINKYDMETSQNQTLMEIPVGNADPVLLTGWSPDGKNIAFAAEVNGQFDIYRLDVETQTLRQLTNTPEKEVFVSWSPTDNRLLFGTDSDPWAFSSWPYNAEKLYLIDESGEKLQSLGEFVNLTSMTWSPDGTQIAYSNEARLCLLTIATEKILCPLNEILPASEYGSAYYYPPAWSADGKWLAFEVNKLAENYPCPYIYLLEVATNSVSDTGIRTCLSTRIYWLPESP